MSGPLHRRPTAGHAQSMTEANVPEHDGARNPVGMRRTPYRIEVQPA